MELKRSEVIKIIEYLRECMKDDEEMSSLIKINEELRGEDLLSGVTNGFLSCLIETITGIKVDVVGKVEELFLCPCCGYKTLSEGYDEEKGTGYCVCPYCGWEDDGTTDIYAYKSINKGRIVDYRRKINDIKDKYYIKKWF